jgi:predicted nucleotidyltransferase
METALSDGMLARMRAILASEPEVEVAALFGSAARGRLRPDSDVDVYVTLRRGTAWSFERENALATALGEACRREIDLIIEDEERTSVILRLEVARHGRLVHEARRGGWVGLRARAMLAYADLEPWMRLCGEGVRRALAAGLTADQRDAHGR